MKTLLDYAFWAVAGYTAVALIGALAAIGATIVAVQIARLMKGNRDV
jgi:hypothetical protein